MMSLVFAAALLIAAAEPAQSAANSPTKAEAANKDGLVCKKEAVVGSRMKSRVCLTQEQWDQRKTDSRQDLDAAQRNRPLVGN